MPRRRRLHHGHLDRAADARRPARPRTRCDARELITERAIGRDFAVAADGFWQPHVHAAEVLADAVAPGARRASSCPGRTGWDLYGGVGLFAEVLCRAVGPTWHGDLRRVRRRASELAAENLAGHPQAAVRAGKVEHVLAELDPAVDVVVLDPPRTGAGPALCAAIATCRPTVIVYVACDPAALGRDTAALAAAGYRLDTLRAFDAFPQTHHIECVARFIAGLTHPRFRLGSKKRHRRCIQASLHPHSSGQSIRVCRCVARMILSGSLICLCPVSSNRSRRRRASRAGRRRVAGRR